MVAGSKLGASGRSGCNSGFSVPRRAVTARFREKVHQLHPERPLLAASGPPAPRESISCAALRGQRLPSVKRVDVPGATRRLPGADDCPAALERPFSRLRPSPRQSSSDAALRGQSSRRREASGGSRCSSGFSVPRRAVAARFRDEVRQLHPERPPNGSRTALLRRPRHPAPIFSAYFSVGTGTLALSREAMVRVGPGLTGRAKDEYL